MGWLYDWDFFRYTRSPIRICWAKQRLVYSKILRNYLWKIRFSIYYCLGEQFLIEARGAGRHFKVIRIDGAKHKKTDKYHINLKKTVWKYLFVQSTIHNTSFTPFVTWISWKRQSTPRDHKHCLRKKLFYMSAFSHIIVKRRK